MAAGLKDFLELIESNAANDVLIDRFTALLIELPQATRQRYLAKLFDILEPKNPLAALRAGYAILQASRQEKVDASIEVEILQGIERIFIRMGKGEQAAQIRAEWEKLAPAVAARRSKKSWHQRLFSNTAAEVPAESPKESRDASTSGRGTRLRPALLLDTLRLHLGSYTGAAQSSEAAAHLVEAFHQLSLARAAWRQTAAAPAQAWWADAQNQISSEVLEVLLLSPLFLSKDQDRFVSDKASVLATLLTSYFDRLATRSTPLPPEQQRVQTKLLERAITSVMGFKG